MRSVTESLQAWLDAGATKSAKSASNRLPVAGNCVIDWTASAPTSPLIPARKRPASWRTYADSGEFRPLKTAPNLRRGWRLNVANLEELRRSLDYFYPAMLGVRSSYAHGSLPTVPLRKTLARQTGMYPDR